MPTDRGAKKQAKITLGGNNKLKSHSSEGTPDKTTQAEDRQSFSQTFNKTKRLQDKISHLSASFTERCISFHKDSLFSMKNREASPIGTTVGPLVPLPLATGPARKDPERPGEGPQGAVPLAQFQISLSAPETLAQGSHQLRSARHHQPASNSSRRLRVRA